MLKNLMKLAEIENASWLCRRQPDNYAGFLNLYKQTAYYPHNISLDLWEAESYAAWHQQDQLIPDTCLGGLNGGSIISSFASQPISHKVAYGHSMCMVKTLAAALTLIPQANLVTKSIKRWPELEYFAGAYSMRSNFTSKLFSDSQGKNIKNQLIIYSHGLSTNQSFSPQDNEDYLLVKVEEFDPSLTLPPDILKLLYLFNSPSELLKSIHQIHNYVILAKNSQRPQAIILKHNSPKFFTALDLLNYCWLIILDNSQALNIIGFLYNQPLFKNAHIELVTADNHHIPFPESVDIDLRCWVFTPKTEAYRIFDYFMQSIYQIISKYPKNKTLEFIETLIQSC